MKRSRLPCLSDLPYTSLRWKINCTVRITRILEIVHAAKVTGISQRHQGGTVSALIQAFQLSPETVIIGLPSEVSVELGLAIKKGSPYANTLLVQLSNDWFGYIPTQRIFEEGNYEAVVAKVRPGEGERIVKATLDLITDLKAQ